MAKYKVILQHECREPEKHETCSYIGDDTEALALAVAMELGIIGDDALCWGTVEAYPYASGTWIVKVEDAE